jgi:hypothetical protein
MYAPLRFSKTAPSTAPQRILKQSLSDLPQIVRDTVGLAAPDSIIRAGGGSAWSVVGF